MTIARIESWINTAHFPPYHEGDSLELARRREYTLTASEEALVEDDFGVYADRVADHELRESSSGRKIPDWHGRSLEPGDLIYVESGEQARWFELCVDEDDPSQIRFFVLHYDPPTETMKET